MWSLHVGNHTAEYCRGVVTSKMLFELIVILKRGSAHVLHQLPESQNLNCYSVCNNLNKKFKI